MNATWEKLPFLDVVNDVSSGNEKVPQTEYLKSGAYPVIDQGKDLIAGYVNDERMLWKGELPVVVFGDHTRNLKYIDFPFCIGADGVKVLSPKKGDARYLYHFLRSIKIESAGYSRHFKFLKEFDVVAPLEEKEQKRIATILDQAESLRAKRRAALEQLDALAQAIFIEMFGHPTRGPKDRKMVSLGELGAWRTGGTPPRSEQQHFEGDVPWFSSGELEGMYISESQEKISKEALQKTSAKPVLAGSILIGMYDTAALKVSISAIDCSCNQAIAFSSLDENLVDAVFVYFSILIGREDYRRMQRGVRQQNLNLSMIRELKVPLPDVALQKKFLNRIETIRQSRQVLLKQLKELDNLFHSLQHRAFRGEL
ncbi:restriction endonuclease subunit S [Pseudomonas sp. ZM23]|uniref:Restriction endonuclease subunit S n=1 Tax=Pseudomonas triclosanedens TaxID=2961893 RepID=A0ABY6ZW89_9PSED|nr:restriction endonuclease subunit S [Pseudomonas triclosanedens]MCP8466501.1 restriction endonuclease subunit S [Pseudomonas triclosanedens]MCP8472144.1 restriction endonuclease subunit S [Pseudomonas triclosanedens]MCP8474472.1 restriction endonuclease subunit S [Pseudomonas triclosanedens]WAI48144.1 restriction endonuclease subunit S [Pseudomonas triclosanedens]